ncbi:MULTISPECIES: helix-turn-helix domain-containing protein [Providencia]|uniref:helix-turn-helix domain-containing protein n=1 Tax=Providencia TaxID=586 RepID=UPI000F7B5795|nr:MULTISPECIES: helix-turn-helix domain-containing protein [Providencia]MBV2188428.1 helix-turn-helix domain-containing protein [Providencia rettgeri]HEC8325343.1 helix-turn-helix domain-containing protein [Providencia rettgeri]
MSTNFCVKSFHSYIETLSNKIKNSFYLTHSLLFKVSSGEIEMRIEEGPWQTLTVSDICFLPKGSSIEIINRDNHNRLAIDVLPMTTDMLKSFYQQHAELFINKKKNASTSQICCTGLHENPIIEDVFHSAIKEINAPSNHNVIHIHLNFILSFFLLVNEFTSTLYASINISIKDKVYDLIFHSAGKQCHTLDTIAKKLHMSSSTLKRRLASEYTNFSKISLMSRMNKAMILSRTENMPMTRIAREVGYDDVPYFLLAFKSFHSQPNLNYPLL